MTQKSTSGKKRMRPLTIARRLCAAAGDKKGLDSIIIDVRGQSSITDYIVIVSAMNEPHLKAISNEIHMQLKKEGVVCYRHAGESGSGWQVMDYLDVVAHILLKEKREYYALENIWSDAKKVE